MAFETAAHTSAHEAPQPTMAADASHHVMQQDVGGARRSRPAIRADNGVGGERHFDFAGFEPLVQELDGALGEDLDQADDFLRAEAAHFGCELQIVDEIAQPLRREFGRCSQQQAFHYLREPFEMVFVGWKCFGIVPREFCDFLERSGRDPAT